MGTFFADQEEDPDDEREPGSEPDDRPEPAYTGPRTLDGRPAPQYASTSSASTSKKPQKKRGLATLSSLAGNDHEDDEDEDDDDEEDGKGPRDLFAGGEKSGLAVQDPHSNAQKVIKDIIAKAKA